MRKLLFLLCSALCVFLPVPSFFALFLGIVFALLIKNPFEAQVKRHISTCLSFAIIGLGAGMNLLKVAVVGKTGFIYTLCSISFTLGLGFILGRLLKVPTRISILLSAGTAICGGSAIAAIAPVIGAENEEVSVSLGVVFILNACALLCFPAIGHYYGFSEHAFGVWSALAIHDTSSVVGATLQYGHEALITGTTIKLARALYIVPLVLIFGSLNRKSQDSSRQKPKRPWFILGFLLMAAFFTYFDHLQPMGQSIELVARRFFVLILFFIGVSLNRGTLRKVGLRPLVQGVLLWVVVAGASFSLLNWPL